MSGTPKKTHEEGVHSSSAKYPHEESGSVFPNLSGKAIPSVANEYHTPTETGPDARMAKVPRIESRDTGKRSPLHSTYRMPSASSNDSHLDHVSNASENRLESRDFKDNKETKVAENRDSKAVAREFYNEPKRDLITVKSEKVERFENKGVDNKEIKQDRNTHNDSKGEIKIEWAPHMYGKEPKEDHRGYMDNWRTSNTSLSGPIIYAKEGLPIEERDNMDVHKDVGENKDLMGEDKFKEKDKKRKDAKHRDVGEVEMGKYDPGTTNSQLTNNNSECKESTMEDREAERTLGKTQVLSVVYKSGECMQGLSKLWKEYESSEAAKNCESSQRGPTLEIRIPAEYVTATNRQVRGGQLWGTDIYTDDSDLVAVLMHAGYLRPTSSTLPPAIQELNATIRVLPPQDCYVSSLRNNVRSRAWGAAIGCSYCVERCCIVKKGGGTINLEPCLTQTSTVEPTLAPVAVERTMTTRAAASNALRQQRFVREVTIQYNLCNEPWIKYSISIVADKGLKKPLYTSARLKKGEVLYLETHSKRYELCYAGEKTVKVAPSSQVHEAEADKSLNNNLQIVNGEKCLTESDNVIIDAFRWSRCKKILPQKAMPLIGIPLPLDYVEVLEDNLDWEDIQWSQSGVWIANKEYTLARVHFLVPN